MNILLIAPASGPWRHVGQRKTFSGKTFRFSMLSLLTVASECPRDANLRIIDEQIDEIPWGESFDLVGITCMTAAAPRAYEIAERFREIGVPVVLGGMHPTFCAKEAANHADAVVVGEAEGVWPRVVRDAKNRCLKPVYRRERPFNLKMPGHPPRHLLSKGKYGTIHAVQATRGCPNQCDYCSVSAFHKATHRKRPITDVVNEVARIPGNFFIFIDDNLTADKDYAARLFDALIPCGKKWVAQTTVEMGEDPNFVKLASRAGCIGVFMGMETFSEKNLNSVNKNFNQVEKYKGTIEILHSHGIGVEAGIVFGFDHDHPDVFENTLKVMDKIKIDAAQISIFTPLPGTPRFNTMKSRIFNFNWSDYDFHHPVFQPSNMSAQDLKEGHDWITSRFYSPGRILLRFLRFLARPIDIRTLLFYLGVNLAYLGRVRAWKIKGRNPGRSPKAVRAGGRAKSPGATLAS